MKVKTLVKNLKKKEFKNANILISFGEGVMIPANRIIHKDEGEVIIEILDWRYRPWYKALNFWYV